jgi:hypothetical protein
LINTIHGGDLDDNREGTSATIRNQKREVDVVLDASFINAWSTRDPTDNQTGYSDPDARVGRADKAVSPTYFNT